MNGIPLTRYQVTRITYYAKFALIFLVAVFLLGNTIHALVFGSGALAESWGALAPDPPVGTALVAWGEPCGKSVEKVFRRKPVVMAEPSSAGLVETLTRLWQERKEEK